MQPDLCNLTLNASFERFAVAAPSTRHRPEFRDALPLPQERFVHGVKGS